MSRVWRALASSMRRAPGFATWNDCIESVEKQVLIQMKVRTNWVVLTGAPSSGKTSVLKALENHGQLCQSEVARAYFEEHLRVGKAVEDLLLNPQFLHSEIIGRMIAQEESLEPASGLILDRAYPDGEAFWLVDGLDPRLLPKREVSFQYREVFIFDPLPISADGIRVDDKKRNEELDVLLEQSYVKRGYSPVRVPVFSYSPRSSVERRVSFVFDNMRSRKK